MAHHGPLPGPFKIPAIKDFVPEKLKPFIIILFVIVFQFSGGVYLATLNEMVGDTALMREDIQMAGLSLLCGMAVTFPIMLRFKLRFISKHNLLVACGVLIVCNFICMYTNNVFVLVATCFVAGIFRMIGTFECNSTIQLWLTPVRDLTVFFCFVYCLIPSAILLSGNANMYVTLFATWRYMHWFIIGALLLVMLIVLLIFNNIRFIPKFPLFGIDWLGMLMWGMILLCVNFITIYGEHYDWWYSQEIWTATFLLFVLLALNIYRASFIRHPFIALRVFKYKAVYLTFFLYIIVEVLLAPQHLVEQIYFENIFKYDAVHLMHINWISWTGVIIAAIFTYFYFAKAKKSYKSTFMIGFAALVLYQLMMYFLIDYNTSKEMLIVPLFVRNFGYVVVAIVLISNLIKVPFEHFQFFQSVAIQTFMSAACGSALGEAILHHFFNHIATENFQLLSANFDSVNHQLNTISPNQLGEVLQNQVLMVSFKEVYGLLSLFGLGCLIVFLFYRYPYFPKQVTFPKWSTFGKMLRKEYAS